MDKKKLKWICPHCDKSLDPHAVAPLEGFWFLKELEEEGLVVLDKMTRNWHTKCWEEFQAQYNEYLDNQDLNGKDGE